MGTRLGWMRLNTTTHRNPKLHGLIEERGGDRAAHVWLAAIEYSVEWQMDGVMNIRDIRSAFPEMVKPIHIALLVKHGFLDDIGNGSYAIHDYLEYQAGADVARHYAEHSQHMNDKRWAAHRAAKARAAPGSQDG